MMSTAAVAVARSRFGPSLSGLMMLLQKFRHVASAIHFNLRVQSLPDRRYLRRVMLPAMADRKPAHVLLAGTRRYTRRYPDHFDPRVTTVWTIDYDPRVTRFGNGPHHRVGDIGLVDTLFSDVKFDVIHINGLLGFGVDEPGDVQRMLEACHRALRPGGHLMLGWDVDRSADPLHHPSLTRLYCHRQFDPLPARQRVARVDGHDHVFDWFQVVPA